MEPKDYLAYENGRNKEGGELFVKLVKRAFGEDYDVLVGHHVIFAEKGDLETENEIPSADTLLFDHAIMGAVFGDQALPVMVELAALPCHKREERLAHFLEKFGGE